MLCSELDFDVKRDENIMDPSRRPFDEHLSDMQGRRQSPNFTQIYDDGVGFESIGYDITLPEKGVPRLQECDLVEVHNFDIPMSLAEWQGHEPSSFNITPVANKLVAVNDQRNSFGTSVVELPTSTIDTERLTDAHFQGDIEGRRCQICNDVASGFHYSVWSCEGCKAFFKRSLQGPVDYVCPATNTCTIDKQRRKACQACRLRRCLEMGMSRGNCRPDKHHADDPTGESSAKRKRIIQKVKRDHEPGLPAAAAAAETSRSNVPHPLVTRLLAIDTPVLIAEHNNLLPDTQATLMGSVLRLGGKELLDIINWAKSVPGYLDLPLHDRIHLLESCWLEILVCGLCWRSAQMPYCAQQVLAFAPDFIMDRARCAKANMLPEGNRLLAVAQHFAEVKLKREEFILLKATVLMNAEVMSAESETILRRNRDLVMQAWYSQCDPRRVCQLLLLLPHIRQVSLHALAKMFELKADSLVSFSDLMSELLESRFVSGSLSPYIGRCTYPNSRPPLVPMPTDISVMKVDGAATTSDCAANGGDIGSSGVPVVKGQDIFALEAKDLP